MVLTPDKNLTNENFVINSSSIRTQKLIMTVKNNANQYVVNVNGVKPGVTRSGRMYVIYEDSNKEERIMYSNTYATTGVLPGI